ncbi:biopolymer transporter ExbD [Amphritea sp. 2_MG-2023]|uniref:ExbD/TolR family protein n=1 Tax=Amphritea TaxID=515417 RepID=UPI001C070553|nr:MULTISPECIES: biopolymer transporter ExbD [Amphritea]MBU2964264.1 biopolymer transporter ExbD [Amphritea atlantica]MDO6419478.1 biopolymer transporter ExbD [Amphritea sp. 2_MG-2023]
MIRVQHKTQLHSSLELTSLIDIIFIVVVFLLLTTNARLLSLPVDIPSSDSEISQQETTTKPIVVSLFNESPAYAIGEERFYTWPEFKASLLLNIAVVSTPEVSIAAARDVEVEPLLKLLALLNEQQVTNTHILMEDAQP